MADFSKWWERFPHIFEAEKAALNEKGITWEIDQAALQGGRIVLKFTYPIGGTNRNLTAVYPDSYPYFAPQIHLHGEQLRRHHNPDGILCLLSSEAESWQPAKDNLASLLGTQIPLIEATTAGPIADGEAAELEDQVGEPLSNYILYHEGSAIIVPDETPPAGVESGRLEVLARCAKDEALPFTGLLRSILDASRKPLVEFHISHPTFKRKLTGFWVRLPERPAIHAGDQQAAHDLVLKIVADKCPGLQKELDAARSGDLFVCGLVYPDEKVWRSNEDDWLFLSLLVTRARKGSRKVGIGRAFIRADWGGDEAMLVRAPFLRPLHSKTVALLGAGTLGSAVALQLAKSGIRELHVVDSDRLQAGNSVRWALGWNHIGFLKAEVLKAHLDREYPRTQAVAYGFRIGAPSFFNEKPFSDHEVLSGLFEKADLVIDATASYRVSHYLADLAKQYGRTYMWLTTTPGAYGGIVGRIQPGRTAGCWHCFQRCLADGSIRLPADSGIKLVQPGGCMQATFVGAGVDSDVIAQLAARIAVATLCGADEHGYTDFPWDVAVADLHRSGIPVPGLWDAYKLEVHPDCPAQHS